MDYVIISGASQVEESKQQELIQYEWAEFPMGEVNYLDNFVHHHPRLSKADAQKLDLGSLYMYQERNQFSKGSLSVLAYDMKSRISKFGDVGANVAKQQVNENGRFYDASDPFIDDGEMGNFKELIDSNIGDYICIFGAQVHKDKQYLSRLKLNRRKQTRRTQSHADELGCQDIPSPRGRRPVTQRAVTSSKKILNK